MLSRASCRLFSKHATETLFAVANIAAQAALQTQTDKHNLLSTSGKSPLPNVLPTITRRK